MKKQIIWLFLMMSITVFGVCQTQPRKETIITTRDKIMVNELASFQMQYLMDEFYEGIIYSAKKGPVEGKINYNILMNVIQYYDKNGDLLAVPVEEPIDSVVLAGHVLVPVRHTLLEIFYTENGPLLLQHTISHKVEKLDEGDQGAALRSSSVDQVVSLLGQTTPADAFKITNPAEEEVELVLDYHPKFFLPTGDNRYIELSSRKNVLRAFPEHKRKVKSFIRKNRTDFDSAEAMRQLASFLHSL